MHTDTRKYGDGVYWEIFIKIKNILFWFVKLPATGENILTVAQEFYTYIYKEKKKCVICKICKL